MNKRIILRNRNVKVKFLTLPDIVKQLHRNRRIIFMIAHAIVGHNLKEDKHL